MGTDVHEYEADCECGKGTIRIRSESDDAPYSSYRNDETVLRECSACGGTTRQKDDPELFKKIFKDLK